MEIMIFFIGIACGAIIATGICVLVSVLSNPSNADNTDWQRQLKECELQIIENNAEIAALRQRIYEIKAIVGEV